MNKKNERGDDSSLGTNAFAKNWCQQRPCLSTIAAASKLCQYIPCRLQNAKRGHMTHALTLVLSTLLYFRSFLALLSPSLPSFVFPARTFICQTYASALLRASSGLQSLAMANMPTLPQASTPRTGTRTLIQTATNPRLRLRGISVPRPCTRPFDSFSRFVSIPSMAMWRWREPRISPQTTTLLSLVRTRRKEK